MAELNPSNSEFANKSSIRWARLFTITPVKGQAIRLTTHASSLVFEGFTYTPAEAIDASAQSEATGGEDFDTSFTGALTSDLLTSADLNNGVYRGASVLEQIVDWRYPYAGALRSYQYFIEDVQWDGEQFDARCAGMNTYLQRAKGRVFSRQCVVDLADKECGVDLTQIANAQMDLTITGTTGDRHFSATLPTQSLPDDWWIWGKVEWLSGANVGRFATMVSYSNPGDFKIAERMPFDIAAGDEVRLQAGCDKTRGTCAGKFNNFQRFQGQPYVRGADQYAPPR